MPVIKKIFNARRIPQHYKKHNMSGCQSGQTAGIPLKRITVAGCERKVMTKNPGSGGSAVYVEPGRQWAGPRR